MQRRTFLNLAVAGSASLVLAGCGFRLRGLDTPLLAMDTIALVASDSDLTPVVRETLENAGTRVRQDAPLRLNLGSESFRESQRTFGTTGSREIEISLTAPFSVQRTSDNAYLLDQQRIEVSTNIQVSSDNLLAQDDMLAEARQRLRQEAADQLLDRLRPLGERQAP